MVEGETKDIKAFLEFNKGKKNCFGREEVLSCHTYIPYPTKYLAITRRAKKWNKRVKKWIDDHKEQYEYISKWIRLFRAIGENNERLKKIHLWLSNHPEFSFLKNHTCYPRLSDGYNLGGYEWCWKNWGTKWGIFDVVLNDKADHSLYYTFTTAWSPPIPFIYTMSTIVPELVFTLSFEESGMDFMGKFQVKNGEVLTDYTESYYKLIKEHKITQYLKLQIMKEGYDRSQIYVCVDDEPISTCVSLFFNDPQNIPLQETIHSIDEAEHYLTKTIPRNSIPTLSIEDEFWGHCSNLQAWVEHGYDTRLLHRSIAFVVLRKLSEAGDPLARQVFKHEVAIRFGEKYAPVQAYLIQEGFLNIFTDEELQALLFDADLKNIGQYIMDYYYNSYNGKRGNFYNNLLDIANDLSENYQISIIKRYLGYFLDEINGNNTKLFLNIRSFHEKLQFLIVFYQLISIVEELSYDIDYYNIDFFTNWLFKTLEK